MALPLNFHRTFIPERRFIAALLEYAAQGKEGTYAEIAAETGIPMGKSTGKVPAILDYARGMGLVDLDILKTKSTKKPVFTSFGRVVYLQDRMMGEPLTQWLAHLHLCLPDRGAMAWHLVFGKGRSSIGRRFTHQQLEDYLVQEFGPGKRRTGPLVRTYLDDAALARSSVLKLDGSTIIRNRAPIMLQYAIGYSAFVITLMDMLHGKVTQMTMTEMEDHFSWLESCLWGQAEAEAGFALMEKAGFLSVDRQMRPWILEKKSSASEVWPRIYDELA